ncbi:hypothetical protein F66182_17351, partial [Fusarium sp. NRRL 66182]
MRYANFSHDSGSTELFMIHLGMIFPLPNGYESDDEFPKPSGSVVGDDGLKHFNRRPMFLSRYTNDEYKQIYRKLLDQGGLECPK